MGERVPPSNYPWWVKVSMWGGLKRTGLWVFVALSIAAAVASFVYGFWDQRFYYLGPAFLVAALMYWLSIRWVDRYGSWTEGA